jgi:hypothetical protein
VVDNKGIFVSYRREETTAYAGWLADTLGNHFGQQDVFRDISSIEPGMDFVEAIDRALESCAVMLVVIGRSWATKLGEHDRTGQVDYTRLEVAAALIRDGVRVIPVLVQGASMPRAGDLPADLAALTRRNATELHDTNWESDVAHLIAQLEKIVGWGEEGTASRQRLVQHTLRDVAKGTIQVRRSEQGFPYQDTSYRFLHVLLDSQEVADLEVGAAVDLEAEPGPHHVEIQATPDWRDRLFKLGFSPAKKSKVTVYVRSNEVINLQCYITGLRAEARITKQST